MGSQSILSLDQQKALALAAARRRQAESAQPAPSAGPVPQKFTVIEPTAPWELAGQAQNAAQFDRKQKFTVLEPWEFAEQEFAARAARMSPQERQDYYIRNRDPFADYLEEQFRQAKPGETPEQQQERLYGKKPDGISGALSALMGAADTLSWGFGDEMAAGIDTTLGSRSYDQALDHQRRMASEASAANPKSYTGGQIGGAVVPAVATFGAAGPTSLGGKMVAGGLAGAGQGGLYGFGSGEGQDDRLAKAAETGAIGLGFGAGAPLLGKAVGATWNGIGNALGRRGLDGKTRTVVVDMLKKAGFTPDQAAARLDAFGPDGMLADLAQVEASGTARASTNAGGLMAERLASRRAGGGGRVGSALDDAFGPASDPYAVGQATKQAKSGLGTLYRSAIDNAPDIPPSAKATALQSLRDSIEGLSQDSRTLGTRLVGQIDDAFKARTPKDTAARLLDLRHSLDEQIVYDGRQQAMLSSADKAAQSTLRKFRGEVDRILKDHVPGIGDADIAHAPLSRQQAAFDFGRRDLLKGGTNTTTPAELDARLTRMTPREREMVGQGARSELARITSNTRRDPGASVDRTLSRDWNSDKIRSLVGTDKAEGLEKALEREATFVETSRLIEPNFGSRTAVLNEAVKRWTGDGRSSDVLSDAATAFAGGTAAGGPVAGMGAAAGVGGKRLVQSLLRRGGVNEKLAVRTADYLSRTGTSRDEVVQAILKAVGSGSKRKATSENLEKVIRALIAPQWRSVPPTDSWSLSR